MSAQSSPEPTEHARVAQAVMDRLGVRDRRGKINRWWSEFFFESGWSRLENRLTMAEWEERSSCACVARLVWRRLTSSALSVLYWPS